MTGGSFGGGGGDRLGGGGASFGGGNLPQKNMIKLLICTLHYVHV